MSVTGNPHRPAQPRAWPQSLRSPLRVGADRRPHALTGAVAHWFAGSVDRELAAGVSPWVSAVVERRAAQLICGRSRRRVAAGLARALRDSTRGPLSWTAVVAPDRHEVSAAHVVLKALSVRLGDDQPVDPRGMAMLRLLLTDGNGPLYQPIGPGSLGSYLRAAAAALEPDTR
jgi:hypothetical protein